jgi:hypothetical protein
MDRETILKSMLSGVSPALPDDQVKSIGTALKAFSVKQLQKMEEAGVRIWPFVKGMPPEYQVSSVPDLAEPAAYNPQFRIVRISPASLERGAITDFLRHELAHAWDNVRSLKSSKSLRKLKGDALLEEVNRRGKDGPSFESQSGKKLPPGNLSMKEMLDAYTKVLKVDRSKSFANPATAEKHLAANVMEFYAEGYSVFHGFTQSSQSRMLWLALDLFNFLDKEAKGDGLASPDREDLKKFLDENEKGWRNF